MRKNLDWNVSNCCGARFLNHHEVYKNGSDEQTDVCSKCKEHADITEVWEQLAYPYEGFVISSYGRLKLKFHGQHGRSFPIKRPCRKPCTTEHGYKFFQLGDTSKKIKSLKVHKLVAAYFVPQPDEDLRLVMHINEDKTKNKANNLKYGTQTENMRSFFRKKYKDGFVRKGAKWVKR